MVRKTTSIIILLSSIIMTVSGIVVYFSPPSHLAFFLGWEFLSLKKNIWMALHVNSSLLFIIANIFHTWFNIKPLYRYLFPKKLNLKKNLAPIIVSLSLCIYMVAGIFYRFPPMTQILKFGKSFKVKGVFSYGPVPPPYGTASNLPLKKIAFFIGSSPANIIKALKKSGIQNISPNQSLKEIAEVNGVSIGFILDSIDKNRNLQNNKALQKMIIK